MRWQWGEFGDAANQEYCKVFCQERCEWEAQLSNPPEEAESELPACLLPPVKVFASNRLAWSIFIFCFTQLQREGFSGIPDHLDWNVARNAMRDEGIRGTDINDALGKIRVLETALRQLVSAQAKRHKDDAPGEGDDQVVSTEDL